jgi:class 3 adenylate cyclase/tetratricopeptide (TPR) repeat protein
MAKTCARCGAAAGDDARFCPSCGSPLESIAGAERKLATLVFADLVGSTQLAADLDPEELRGRLAPFFEVARSTLEEHGGTVEKYIGDAIMAMFGVPRAHGDDPDRAVSAALELTQRVAGLDAGLSLRVGVETGEVLALERGGDLSVTGEAVNAAARLQAAAAENEILVGPRAARSCRSVRLEPRGTMELKGFPTPVEAWRAVASGRATPRPDTPFMGRDEDLDLLRMVYRRAVHERLPELVMITGDSGIGKTRLASELLAVLRETNPEPEVLLGRNPPYGRGIAFWALGEILRSAAGASADDSVAEVHDALADRLAELGAEDPHELARALATALGGEARDGDVEDELKRAWRRLVALLARERPLVIGIDDAHWADDGLLDLIEETAFSVDGAPVLLLCTSRPELLERRPGFGRGARNVTQIELRPLARDPTTQLAAVLLGDRPHELATRVAEVSGGNPFFAEEVAQRIIEDPDAAVEERLPETVQAAIAARLDLLPPDEKRAIQYAAVLGPGFLEEALADLLGGSPSEALDALARKALVQERVAEGGGRYGFRHQLIREVAYTSLPKAERVRLHERAAEGILDRAGERYPELAELVAFHRLQAAELAPTPGRSAEARRASMEAAEALFRRGASRRSQHLYEEAADLAQSPAERVEALRAASQVAVRRFRGDEAVELLREMAGVAEDAGDRGSAAAAYALAVESATRMSGITGWLPESELTGMLRRGQELADAGDPATRARLVLDEAWIAWSFDRPEELGRPARAGLKMARDAGDAAVLSAALDAASASAWHAGGYREAVGHNRERLEVLDRVPRGEPATEVERSDALHMMVESLVQVGDYREALAYAARARDLDLNRGIVYSGWSRAMLPSFFLGEWDEVLTMGRRVREALTAMGRPPSSFMAGAIATAGAVMGLRGEEDASEDWMSFATEIGGKGGQVLGIVTFRADVALHQGRPAEAVETLERGSAASLFWWRPHYLATRAEALVQAGRRGAESAIDEARARIGDNPFARAIAIRAAGMREGDEAKLRAALAIFEEVECPYQAARTGWLLGGEDRQGAERTFERLGATLPPD